MHNNRYSTGEGVMRLFTVDHPQITLSPSGEGGYPAPSPADLLCFVSTAAALLPIHSFLWVLCGHRVRDRCTLHDVRLATHFFGMVQKIRPERALV